MPTEDTKDSAPQPLPPTPSGDGTGAASGSPAPAQPAIPAELQPVVDKVVADRLKRAQDKWKADQEAKAAADTDAAEAKRLEDEKKFQELAQKHERRAVDLDAKLKTATADLEKATALINGLLESKKKGLPESVAKLLEGRSIFEQLEIADAFLAAQPAGSGGRTASTNPTPSPQTGGQQDFVRLAIERQNKRATGNDPNEAMMKR